MKETFAQAIQILSSPLVGTLLGIAGLVVAFVTYVLTRQRRILAFQQKGQKLLGHETQGLPDTVGVTYRGRAIPRVTKTFVVLWNAGEKVISGSDIVSSDRLRLDVGEDAEILSCSVRAMTRPVTAFDVAQKSSRVAEINFDFLDAEDGAVVEMLHTSPRKNVAVAGTVKGLPRGLSNRGGIVAVAPVKIRDPISLDLLLYWPTMNWLVLVLSALAAWYSAFHLQFLELRERMIMLSIAGAYMGLSGSTLWRLKRRFPRSLAKALETQG